MTAQKTELYGAASCPYTRELREWLEWNGREFFEYDVDADSEALSRLREATNGQRTVPVLIEDGTVVQIGWQGRGCIAGGNPNS
jgi:glutaredoxin